jgi:hypothetical protein
MKSRQNMHLGRDTSRLLLAGRSDMKFAKVVFWIASGIWLWHVSE